MQFSKTIETPGSFNAHLLATNGQFDYSLTEVVTNIFVAYFADERYAELDQAQRVTVANVYKELLGVLILAEASAIKWHNNGDIKPIPEIEVCDQFYDRFSNIWDALAVLKILDNAFLAFLSEDAGNDLHPTGYVNTNAAMAKSALFDFFEALLRHNVLAAVGEVA